MVKNATQRMDLINRESCRKMEALKLHEEANVPVNEYGSTLEDVKKFSEYLGVQVNIVDGDQFNNLIFSSEEVGDMVYLYKNGNHFDVITSMPGFLCKDYYCHSCKKPYDTMRDSS